MTQTPVTEKSPFIFIVRKIKSSLPFRDPMQHDPISSSLSFIDTRSLDVCCAKKGKTIEEVCKEHSKHPLDIETFSMILKRKNLVFNLFKEKIPSGAPCNILLSGTTIDHEGEDHVPTLRYNGTPTLDIGIFRKKAISKDPLYVVVYKRD